jgi:hypothetical protein
LIEVSVTPRSSPSSSCMIASRPFHSAITQPF